MSKQRKRYISVAATKTVNSIQEITESRCAVNQSLKSVVREICTLRSVGTGGGQLPPVTRWMRRV